MFNCCKVNCSAHLPKKRSPIRKQFFIKLLPVYTSHSSAGGRRIIQITIPLLFAQRTSAAGNWRLLSPLSAPLPSLYFPSPCKCSLIRTVCVTAVPERSYMTAARHIMEDSVSLSSTRQTAGRDRLDFLIKFEGANTSLPQTDVEPGNISQQSCIRYSFKSLSLSYSVVNLPPH